jgi:hypothetical protein
MTCFSTNSTYPPIEELRKERLFFGVFRELTVLPLELGGNDFFKVRDVLTVSIAVIFTFV